MVKLYVRTFKIIISFLVLFQAILSFGAHDGLCNTLYTGYSFVPSKMMSVPDKAAERAAEFLLAPNEAFANSDPKDGPYDVESFMNSRRFKTWFDFKDHAKNNFSKDIDLKPALVKQVESPQEGLLAKLMIIRQAKFTIDLTYYIFKNDETGYVILNELKEALRRGVSVRVMVDSVGSINPLNPAHSELKSLLDFAKDNAGFVKDKYGNVTNQKAKIELVAFRSVNPIQIFKGVARKFVRDLYTKFLALFGVHENIDTVYVNPGRRSHDKILIADQNFPELAIAIIGGRNISNHYYGIPKVDENTFMDMEVIVKNDLRTLQANKTDTITTNIGDLYDLLYFHSGNRVITETLIGKFLGYKKQNKQMERAKKFINDATKDSQSLLGEDFRSADFGKKYLSEGFFEGTTDLSYTFDNVLRSMEDSPLDPAKLPNGDRTKNSNHINREIESYLAKEDEHIVLVSPYLWLSDRQVEKFKRWLGEKPYRKLTIITNSIMTSDNMMAQTLVDATLGPQLVLDRTYRSGDGDLKEYTADQIELYEYGKIDSIDLGGKTPYGKLHAKAMLMKALEGSFISTFNGDPRSQYLNSELGLFIFSKQHSVVVEKQIQELILNSHIWGSQEYYDIRRHPKLSKTKRFLAHNVDNLYKLMKKLGIMWLI